MYVFLNGGGAGEQTKSARACLYRVVDHAKPCLYIPLAMEPERYAGCRDWIAGELADIKLSGIDMVCSGEELAGADLSRYSMLFLGGGNTFRLLRELKQYGAFTRIREYLRNGGILLGGSAGAIVCGYDLESCVLEYENTVGLTDITGLNLLQGTSVLCHYGNHTPEKDSVSRKYLLELSQYRKTYALPEEVTLFITENSMKAIGDRPYFLFSDGAETVLYP